MVSKQIVDANDNKENLMANGAAGYEEEFMMVTAQAGGDDYEDAGEEWVVWTAAGDLMAVSKGIEAQGFEVKGAELTMGPTTPTAVSGADAKKVQRLIDRLEDLDDVQDVYSTMDMTVEVIAALEEEYEDAGEEWVVWTAAGDLMAVSKGIEAQGFEVKGAELTMGPTTPTAVSGADAKKVQRLIDRLEDLDDVQDVYSTMDMTVEVIAALEEE